jgi:hypothetical protein
MALYTCGFVQIEIDLSSCLHHPFGYTLFHTLKLPNGFQFAGR